MDPLQIVHWLLSQLWNLPSSWDVRLNQMQAGEVAGLMTETSYFLVSSSPPSFPYDVSKYQTLKLLPCCKTQVIVLPFSIYFLKLSKNRCASLGVGQDVGLWSHLLSHMHKSCLLYNNPEENASTLPVPSLVDDWSLCLLFLLTDGKAHY